MTNRRSILLAAAGAGAASGLEAGGAQSSTAIRESETFHAAVLAGEMKAVVAMLDRDPSLVYARDSHGVSVYLLACLNRRTEVAEELVKRGIALDIFEAVAAGNDKRAAELAKDDPGVAHHRLPDGRMPLHVAVEAGKPAMVIFCAMRGADLSAGPESPLLAAVDYPDASVAREMAVFLLMNASDPKARRTRDGKSAVQIAASRGYGDLVEMLLHRGADPADIPNPPKVERVYFGRRYTQDRRENAVTREDTYGIPQEWINQFVSVAHFDFEKVKQLQKLCPTLIQTRATWDELAIEASSHMGLTPMAEFLADLGAPVSTCTATLLGEQELVKRLLHDDPASIRERGAHDIALLAYTALGKEHVDIAAMLLDAGADPHARSLGQTTLHIAAGKGHLELSRILLDHGADVNATARLRGVSLTPLAIAIQAKHDSLANFLRDRGGRA